MLFGVSMVWRELKNYHGDCYFCMVVISGWNQRKKNDQATPPDRRSPPVLSGYNGSPDTRFSRGTTQLMSLPDGERCLRPPQSLVVSLLLSLVSSLVLSRTGGVLSLQSILTHRFPQFPLRNLCSLVMLAVSSLVFAAMDTAFF